MNTQRASRLSLFVTMAALAAGLVLPAGASAATFSAHGSAEQVYVLGLSPGARMSLLNSAGHTVATQSADPQGGLLFRNVPPGSGYRVRPSSGGLSSTHPAALLAACRLVTLAAGIADSGAVSTYCLEKSRIASKICGLNVLQPRMWSQATAATT